MHIDPNGDLWGTLGILFVAGAISGVLGQLLSDILSNKMSDTKGLSSLETYLGAAVGGGLGMLVGYATGWNSVVSGAATGFFTSYSQDFFNRISGNNNYLSPQMLERAFTAAGFGALSGYVFGKFLRFSPLNAGRNSCIAVFKSGITKSIRYGFSMSLKTIGKGVFTSVYEGLILDIYFGYKQSGRNIIGDILQFD